MDEPLPVQYWRALTDAVRGDFGPCMKLGDYPVSRVIAEGLPISAALGILALSFALALGLTTGIVAAAWIAIEPHPHPTSSSRMPGACPSLRATSSSFARWASSRVYDADGACSKYAQE